MQPQRVTGLLENDNELVGFQYRFKSSLHCFFKSSESHKDSEPGGY